MLQIIITGDGSNTLYVEELNEHYHSVHGAVGESDLVFIRNGFMSCLANPVRIFEVGFGTGLNAFLTAIRSDIEKRPVYYTAVEKHPLPPEITNSLNYPAVTGYRGKDLFRLIHTADWERDTKITEYFQLTKIRCDLTLKIPHGIYDLVYFDAFGPDKQPEMWSREIFSEISSITASGGILVTYSVKGSVKRILRDCGFKIILLPGPPGKREVLRAVKNL